MDWATVAIAAVTAGTALGANWQANQFALRRDERRRRAELADDRRDRYADYIAAAQGMPHALGEMDFDGYRAARLAVDQARAQINLITTPATAQAIRGYQDVWQAVVHDAASDQIDGTVENFHKAMLLRFLDHAGNIAAAEEATTAAIRAELDALEAGQPATAPRQLPPG